ncbi:hypothetical protein [Actinoallomurus iriomotensis]|uniref:Uncharacterized protein n=1 Tax=Actinoallomurus iriomotensis TaxID=478107 RepID=A0A9W6VV25_9ACTN|nr:hypothetical protein [Actinoallomurus iriomotensis]GLY80769.1 hypothetical protein Airi01_090360 [Actinoallomurus iriomotensis]
MRRSSTPDTTGTRVFAQAPFARFHVEYPEAYDSRFPAGRVVALGVVDARSPRPETVDELLSRIDTVAGVLPILARYYRGDEL